MRILSATQAKYNDDTQTAINCVVSTDAGAVDVPFTAHVGDCEAYSRDLFVALQVNGLADWYAPQSIDEML